MTLENSCKVSVIVAVYKAENYIRKCIDSLLAQDFDSFEILLIDDGSPDKSGEICDEYASKFKNIKVFHKQNEGVGATRQFGLEHATGEYIIHADPDDWVEPNMLSELYAKAKSDNADMVICDSCYEYKNFSKQIKQEIKSLDHLYVFRQIMSNKITSGPCNKLIRRDCFSKYNISFPKDLLCYEDQFANALLLINNIKITYLPKCFYHYCVTINPNSLSLNFGVKQNLKYSLEIINKTKDYFKKEPYRSIALKTKVNCIMYSYFCNRKLTSAKFKEIFKPLKNSAFYNRNFILGSLLYLSCLGFYRQMFFVYKVCKFIKHALKKLIFKQDL